MSSDRKRAPIVRLSAIAPSLTSIPGEIKRTPKNIDATSIPLQFIDDDSFFNSLSVKFNEHEYIQEDEDDDKPKIPDGGWGWMVVLSSSILCLIQDGISFSFGILFPEFIREFNATGTEASWIGSLFVSVPLLTGPIMSAMVDKYGCRNMTILAGLVSSSGFVLSFFVKDIRVMYLTFGMISGLGLGLSFVTAVVSIAFWFEKKRNLAVGLGACGVGIGTFVYAPFTTYLLYEFGWRWTVVLLGGTLLNMCVCGALMRDPDWMIEQNKKEIRVERQKGKIDVERIKKLLTSGKDGDYISHVLSIQNEKEYMSEGHQSVLDLPTFIKQYESVPIEVLQQLRENKEVYKIILDNYPNLINNGPTKSALKDKKNEKPKSIQNQKSLSEDSALCEPFLKEKLVRRRSSAPKLVKQITVPARNVRFNRRSLGDPGALFKKTKDKKRYTKMVDSLKEMFDFTLFLEFHFLLMSMSTIILFMWFMTPYFYLPDHMQLRGHSKSEASITMAVMGFTSTVGMVVLGWAGDQNWCNVPKTYAICLALCGICCCLQIIVSHNFILLTVVSAFYGFFLASSFSFTPIILTLLLPLETFTKAYGLTLLCQGIGHLAGPPVAAYLFDVTKTWNCSFYLSAVWIAISGALIVVIPYTRNRIICGGGLVEKEKELVNDDKLAVMNGHKI